MTDYLFDEIETRWQRRWEDEGSFEVQEDPTRPRTGPVGHRVAKWEKVG